MSFANEALSWLAFTTEKFVHQITWKKQISTSFGGYDAQEIVQEYALKGLILPIKDQSKVEFKQERGGALVMPEFRILFNRIDLETAGLFNNQQQLLMKDTDSFTFNDLEFEVIGIVGVGPDIPQGTNFVLYQVYARKKIQEEGVSPM